MTAPKSKRAISARIPEDVAEQLDLACDATGLSQADIISQALDKTLADIVDNAVKVRNEHLERWKQRTKRKANASATGDLDPAFEIAEEMAKPRMTSEQGGGTSSRTAGRKS